MPGHHGGGGHGHHGGGGHRGRGGRRGGYPYLLDDYGPTLVVVSDDCGERVRRGCRATYAGQPAAEQGCVTAGLSRCGVGALDETGQTRVMLVGLAVLLATGFVLFKAN